MSTIDEQLVAITEYNVRQISDLRSITEAHSEQISKLRVVSEQYQQNFESAIAEIRQIGDEARGL
jgi:hypothetical protein